MGSALRVRHRREVFLGKVDLMDFCHRTAGLSGLRRPETRAV
jgi:hypothetical protein